MSSDGAESGSESISSEGEEVVGDMFEIGYWESDIKPSVDIVLVEGDRTRFGSSARTLIRRWLSCVKGFRRPTRVVYSIV